MKKLSILFLTLFATVVLKAQTVDGIISNYLENIGGVDKWKALQTIKLTGTAPTPQGEFEFEQLKKAPNKIFTSISVMGQKLIPVAYDGEVAWTLNPFTGDPNPQKLPEDQAASAIQEAEFEDAFIDYSKKGHEVTYEGTTDIEGIKCYHLKLTKNKGKGEEEVVISYFLDSETYLPIATKQVLTSGQMAGQEVSIFFSDYQDAGDGMIVPHTVDQRIGGQSIALIKFTKIELNGDIPDSVFKFPGE